MANCISTVEGEEYIMIELEENSMIRTILLQTRFRGLDVYLNLSFLLNMWIFFFILSSNKSIKNLTCATVIYLNTGSGTTFFYLMTYFKWFENKVVSISKLFDVIMYGVFLFKSHILVLNYAGPGMFQAHHF